MLPRYILFGRNNRKEVEYGCYLSNITPFNIPALEHAYFSFSPHLRGERIFLLSLPTVNYYYEMSNGNTDFWNKRGAEVTSENPEAWTCQIIRQCNRKERDIVHFEGEHYYLCEVLYTELRQMHPGPNTQFFLSTLLRVCLEQTSRLHCDALTADD